MIKRLLFATSLIATTAFAGTTTESYNLKITVKGGKKDSACFLANHYGEKQYIQDTAKFDANGLLNFTGNKALPGGIYMLVLPNKKYFEFIVTEKEQNFTLETDTTDFVKNMKIKGSNENKFFFEYLNFINQKQKEIEPLRNRLKVLREKEKENKDSIDILQKQAGKIDEEVKGYKANFAKDHPETFVSKLFKAMEDPIIPEAPKLPNGKTDSTFAFKYFKQHYWDNIDFTDDKILRTPLFHNKLKHYMEKMTLQHPDSISTSADIIVEKARANKEIFKYVVYWITYTYETSQYMGMDAVFVHMAEKYYMTKQAYWIDTTQLRKITDRATTLKPLLIGKYCPSIIMRDTSGITKSLYDVKAKFTVVMFWDYNCSHCKKSIPKLVELYNTKLKALGTEVFSISTEYEEDPWKKFVKDNKMNFINVADIPPRSYFKKTFDIYSTPVVYLLDENKKIIAKRIEVEQLQEFIERQLGMKPSEKKEEKKK